MVIFKDDSGQNADSKDNPVVRALPNLKSHFPTLTLVCDVCLCPYTSHGHCGLLNKDGSINNDASLQRIAEVALAYAKAGTYLNRFVLLQFQFSFLFLNPY